jgi:hypothetical protein
MTARVLPSERGKPPQPPPADKGKDKGKEKGGKSSYGKSKDDRGKGYRQPYPSSRYDSQWGWRY